MSVDPCTKSAPGEISHAAHSAIYDAERTATLFCLICNMNHESFQRADEKARALGWKDGAPAPLDLVEEDQ